MGAGAREWVGREKEGVGEKVSPYLLIKAANLKRLPTSLKTRLFPKGHAERRDWIIDARIDEYRAIRGHDLCFDKTCQ